MGPVRACYLSAILLAMGMAGAYAAVSSQEAQALKSSLTPVGAIRAGNEAGTIPPWKCAVSWK